MPVRTHVDEARTRVRTEREAVDAKLAAIDEFVDRVADLSAEPVRSSTADPVAAGSGPVRAGTATEDRCRTVRTIFAETVRPHSVDDVDEDESLQETIRAELSASVAVALAPTTETAFSPALRQAVLSGARTRRAETAAVGRALERERSQLDAAGTVVDEAVDWITTADETPLSGLGFDELRRRHETLATYRDRCGDVAERRQSFLDSATNEGAAAGVDHRSLVPSLYRDFPVDHPVLVTVARLADTCRECQRVVRRHLVRRA